MYVLGCQAEKLEIVVDPERHGRKSDMFLNAEKFNVMVSNVLGYREWF